MLGILVKYHGSNKTTFYIYMSFFLFQAKINSLYLNAAFSQWSNFAL